MKSVLLITALAIAGLAGSAQAAHEKTCIPDAADTYVCYAPGDYGGFSASAGSYDENGDAEGTSVGLGPYDGPGGDTSRVRVCSYDSESRTCYSA